MDLFYRLSVFPIEVPPLKDRLEDIPLLASHFAKLACRRLGVPEVRFTNRHLDQLKSHSWPGNIRELENTIERAVITSRTGNLEFYLPGLELAAAQNNSNVLLASRQNQADEESIMTCAAVKSLERDNIVAALIKTNWKLSGFNGAAELLGIKVTTLASKMKAMSIKRPS